MLAMYVYFFFFFTKSVSVCKKNNHHINVCKNRINSTFNYECKL